MGTTLRAVYIALQIAPLIALALILPQVIIRYIKDKSLNVRRSTYLYVFVMYFICAYFMTMLPLPTPESLETMKPVSELIQLIPFKSLFDIKLESVVHDVAIIVFNFILTMPLGFFLRFLFNFNLKKTALAGFLTALLYEVTQLTGLFFIYPRPYRIFDIDDFIVNTTGAIIGYALFPLLVKILPSPNESKRQLVQGSEVSFFQRCVASFIDVLFSFAVATLIVIAIPPLRAFFGSGSIFRFPLFYVIFIVVCLLYGLLLSGGTLGQRLVGLRLLGVGGVRASRIKVSLRFTLICSSTVAIPFWVYFFMTVNTEYAGWRSVIWVFLGALLMMCVAAVLLEMMFNAVTHGSSMFYDRAFKTHVAYGTGRRSSLFGIRVIDIKPLEVENVDALSEKLYNTLLDMGVERESVIKLRLMAEGVMLDWIERGLSGTPCELRLDKRFKLNALMLSVSGEDKTNVELSDGYAEMLSGLSLTLDTYYAGEKNICNIRIPKKD